jgi:hypothetical protein
MRVLDEERSIEEIEEDQERLKAELARLKALRRTALEKGNTWEANTWSRRITEVQERIRHNRTLMTVWTGGGPARAGQDAATNVQTPRAPMPRPGHHHPE